MIVSLALQILYFVIYLLSMVNCCSFQEINSIVDNAFISCMTNVSCNASCYRGYIFSNGYIRESYSCINGGWKPELSSCKRIPIVSVTYSVFWSFEKVIPSHCDNISRRLDASVEQLVDTFTYKCQSLNIDATVQFTYSFLAFSAFGYFEAVYLNFTNWNLLSACIQYIIDTTPNQRIFKTMFDGVTCRDSISNSTIIRSIHVKMYDTHEYCNDSMDVFNVSTSGAGHVEQFCDIKDEVTTFETTFLEKHISSQPSTMDMMFSSASSYVNMTATGLVFIKQIITTESESETSIYILVPVAGFPLLFGVVVLVIYRKKRAEAQERKDIYETSLPDGQAQYLNMTDNLHQYEVIGYKSQRRENRF